MADEWQDIARGLSVRQKAWLGSAFSGQYDGYYTHPPYNTHRVNQARKVARRKSIKENIVYIDQAI